MRKSNRALLIFIKVIFVFVFLIVGGVFTLISVGISNQKERCTMEVPAVVIDIKESSGESGTLYSPVYQIELDGEIETRSNNTYSSDYPTIGDETTIFLNPDDMQEYYAPDDAIESLMSIFKIIGIVFLVIAAVTIFIPIRRR